MRINQLTQILMKKELSTKVDYIAILQSKIYEIRGKFVMFDKDIASLYGIETKVLNQSVKRNIERFPEDFMFQLTKEDLRSQFVTSKGKGGINMS